MEYEGPNRVIAQVGKTLSQPMPWQDKDKLKEHLAELDALRYTLAETTVKWHRMLSDKRLQFLHPKDKELTELDRSTMLNANVSIIQRDYDFLVRLETLIDSRLELGKYLLS
jgi:hypothetical protein